MCVSRDSHGEYWRVLCWQVICGGSPATLWPRLLFLCLHAPHAGCCLHKESGHHGGLSTAVLTAQRQGCHHETPTEGVSDKEKAICKGCLLVEGVASIHFYWSGKMACILLICGMLHIFLWPFDRALIRRKSSYKYYRMSNVLLLNFLHLHLPLQGSRSACVW